MDPIPTTLTTIPVDAAMAHVVFGALRVCHSNGACGVEPGALTDEGRDAAIERLAWVTTFVWPAVAEQYRDCPEVAKALDSRNISVEGK